MNIKIIFNFINSIQFNELILTILPIIVIGIITDKYQEEFNTKLGNVISNGALLIFSGFSWFQIIDLNQMSEYKYLLLIIYTFLIIIYGMFLIGFSLEKKDFIKKYGNIRIITYILTVSTIMIFIPKLFTPNYIFIVFFIGPYYYLFISKILPAFPELYKNAKNKRKKIKYSTPIKNKIIQEYFKNRNL